MSDKKEWEMPMPVKVQIDDLEAVKTIVEAIQGFQKVDQERILRWTREKLGLDVIPQQAPTAPATQPVAAQNPAKPPPAADGMGAGASIGGKADIKSFVERKSPPSDAQFAAVVAYYYQFEASPKRDGITAAELLDACRLTDRARLKKPAQTLVNAHAQGLLDRGERGTYRLNTVGENLVAMALPPAAGASVPARRPKRVQAKKAAKNVAKKRPGSKK